MARDGVHGHEHAQEGSTDERWSPWQPRGWLGSPSSGDSPVVRGQPRPPPRYLAVADGTRRRQGGQGGELPSSSR